MKEHTKGKLAAFASGAVIGYVVGAVLKGSKQVGDSPYFTVGTIGAYLGAMIWAVIYAKSKLIGALWAFWLVLAIAITWSL